MCGNLHRPCKGSIQFLAIVTVHIVSATISVRDTPYKNSQSHTYMYNKYEKSISKILTHALSHSLTHPLMHIHTHSFTPLPLLPSLLTQFIVEIFDSAIVLISCLQLTFTEDACLHVRREVRDII